MDKRKFLPRLGMRKLKSILAVFVGFWVWQAIRLLVPALEIHPIYIYIYGIIEMRESSEKTIDFGKLRIKTTVVALLVGLPLIALSVLLKSFTETAWVELVIEMAIILVGVFLSLSVAEAVNCKSFCGLAAAIFVILVVFHTDDEPLAYSVLRAVQTVIGVAIAWFINVKLFPYPRRPKEKTEETS